MEFDMNDKQHRKYVAIVFGVVFAILLLTTTVQTIMLQEADAIIETMQFEIAKSNYGRVEIDTNGTKPNVFYYCETPDFTLTSSYSYDDAVVEIGMVDLRDKFGIGVSITDSLGSSLSCKMDGIRQTKNVSTIWRYEGRIYEYNTTTTEDDVIGSMQ